MEVSKAFHSVQELAREPFDSVPEKYVRHVADYPTADPCDPSSLRVPVVDMANLVKGESLTLKEELQKLHSACTEWGAFQLVNHGVLEEIIKEMKKCTQEFYDLPLQEKMRCAQKAGSFEGYGQAFTSSQKQVWCDMLFVKALPLEIRNLSFWPESPQGFRKIMDIYSNEMRTLAVSLLGVMGMATGLGAHEFSNVCEDGLLHLRMNYYPPCSQPENVLGSAPHTDVSSITLLLEFDDTPGLQIQKDGFWTTIKPVPCAILIIIGHSIEIMSNGIYKAPEHRAVVNKSKERISIVSFCCPGSNATIQPVRNLIKPGYPAIYKAISQPDYFHRFYNRKPGEKFIDTLKVDGFEQKCT